MYAQRVDDSAKRDLVIPAVESLCRATCFVPPPNKRMRGNRDDISYRL